MKKFIKTFLTFAAILSFSFLLACSSGSSGNDDKVKDYSSDASDAGYTVPDVDVRGISDVSFDSKSGKFISDSKSGSSSSTEDGVITADIELDDDFSASDAISVYIWINNNLYLISGATAAGGICSGDIVLSNGYNYICIVVYVNGVAWGRSEVSRIESTTAASLMRFELTWDGEGDVDLHLDNTTAGIHVFWSSSYYDYSGYDIDLDIDNMVAYGPENIRVYTVPSSTQFRCYVNYYSGSSNLTATVKVFDKDNKLTDTKTITLTPADSGAGSDYNEQSKLVGTYTVNP